MTAKITPSTSRRDRTAWPGSTNWGRNVTKKTPSFGLLIAERNPCRKTAWAGAAGGAPAGRVARRRPRLGMVAGPRDRRKNAPTTLVAAGESPEVGGGGDNPTPPAGTPAARARAVA